MCLTTYNLYLYLETWIFHKIFFIIGILEIEVIKCLSNYCGNFFFGKFKNLSKL